VPYLLPIDRGPTGSLPERPLIAHPRSGVNGVRFRRVLPRRQTWRAPGSWLAKRHQPLEQQISKRVDVDVDGDVRVGLGQGGPQPHVDDRASSAEPF